MKKLIIAITAVAVAAGGTFGAYKLNEKRKTNKAVAEVTPVSLMTDYYYGDTLELGGMISSGNIQNVMPDDQKLVEKVLVKEGDSVKKGDPLLKYDITALELDLKQKENAVAVADSDIKTANKELTKLKNLKSSEMMPEPPEPTFPPTEAPTEPPQPENPVVETKDTIKSTADSVSGDGSSKNPLVFDCTPETVVTGEFFSTLKENGGYAVFNVYDENSEMLYLWRISGADINDAQISDKVIGENVSADADGNITVSWSENTFGSYTVPKTSDIPEDYSYEESYEEEPFDYESNECYSENIIQTIQEENRNSSDRFINIHLELSQQGAVSIRSYTVKNPEDISSADYVQLSTNDNVPVIPGTSWAGAFRERFEEFAGEEDTVKELFGFVDTKNKTQMKSKIYFS
ncbi:MAG: biotin/lipoyl-binding protein, partial [Porcipelethomonas sp.]